MNEKVFVDTVAWIALLNQYDALHQQASTMLQQLHVENKGLITSEFILICRQTSRGFSADRDRYSMNKSL